MKRVLGVSLVGACLMALSSQWSAAQWLQVYKFYIGSTIKTVSAAGPDFLMGRGGTATSSGPRTATTGGSSPARAGRYGRKPPTTRGSRSSVSR
jgi:hypothetical protein